jgi:hypothetical protein
MPDQRDGNDEDALGIDWLAAQLTDDDDEGADQEAGGTVGPGSDAEHESAPTVALPVVPPAAPPASSRELRFSSTAAGTDDSARSTPAENFPTRAERVEAERAEADRIEAERVDAERVVAIRAAADRAAAERAAADRAAAERVEAERAEAERLQTQRVEAQRAQAVRAEAVRAEVERAERAELQARRAQAERAEAERTNAERAAAERAAADRAEAEQAAAPASASDDDPSTGDSGELDESTDDTGPGVFLWGLTPTIEPDPVVESRRAEAKAAHTPAPAAVQPAAPAPAAPAPAAPAPSAEFAEAAAAERVPPAPATAPAAGVGIAVPPPVTATSVPAEPTEPIAKAPFTARRPLSDPEAAPWWTTPAQARLEPTDDERAAAQARRTAPGPLAIGAATRTIGAGAGVAAGSASADTGPSQPGSAAVSAVPVSAAAAAAVGATAAPLAPVAVAAGADRAASRSGSIPAATFGTPAGAGDTTAGGPPRRASRRTLAWAGTAVLAVLVIIGLFFLAQSLNRTPVAAPVATESEAASAEPTPTPTPTPDPTAPQPAGVHAWDTMFGSECLEPYMSPWDEEFTVVDCATPHAAQLVYRGVLEGESGSEFPGEQAFAEQINVLCSAPGVIDFAAAADYDDLQLQGSYPVTAEQWADGDRYFYCFASRSSGEPLTTSVAPVA